MKLRWCILCFYVQTVPFEHDTLFYIISLSLLCYAHLQTDCVCVCVFIFAFVCCVDLCIRAEVLIAAAAAL